MRSRHTRRLLLVDSFLPPGEAVRLADDLANVDAFRLTRRDATFGARNLLQLDSVRGLIEAPSTHALIGPLIGPAFRCVRALFFDKTPEANWPVAWHQDLSVPLAHEADLPGWTGWSVKGGVVHAQPPAEILSRMITLRIHLDDCWRDNGPLRVIGGSHAHGRLARADIERLRASNAETVCCGPAGSALLMKPLLLHASSPARSPSHRRVLQLEFAPDAILPEPLRWAA